MNLRSAHENELLKVEEVNEEVLVLDSENSVVHRLTGDAASYVRRLAAMGIVTLALPNAADPSHRPWPRGTTPTRR